jgi:uncharacterized coiled-coil protein SlyX
MATMQTLERRIQALEARLADVDGGFGETIYRLRRSTVRTDLRLTRVMDHLGIEDVSEEGVDAELDRG